MVFKQATSNCEWRQEAQSRGGPSETQLSCLQINMNKKRKYECKQFQTGNDGRGKSE